MKGGKERVNEIKFLKNKIQESINSVKEAEKCCLDMEIPDKLDIVKDLMEAESQIRTIRDALPVQHFKITENTEIRELYDEDLISVRAMNVLRRSGCDTVSDIIQHTEEELMKMHNMGRNCLKEILDLLHRNGFRIKNDKTVNVGEEGE